MKHISLRIGEELDKDIEAHAAALRTTKSDVILQFISDGLYKETDIEMEFIGILAQIRSEISKSITTNQLFQSLFLYFLKYFFAYNDMPDLPSEERKIMMEHGEIRSQKFTKNFKQELPKIKNIIEILFADYMEKDE